jgi:hypothetical protein
MVGRPIGMKTTLALAGLLLVLTSCGSEGDSTATDPSGDPSGTPAATADIPADPASVRTRTLATVLDTGEGAPELCLGPIAESYPPQCSGPELVGWDWRSLDEVYEQEAGTTWGQFAVSGTWDGERLTVTEAVPAALYDPMPSVDQKYPVPAEALGQAELERIQAEVQDQPWALGAFVTEGHVIVDVTYDDGSLQDWADQTYGEAIVVVSGQLVDVEG